MWLLSHVFVLDPLAPGMSDLWIAELKRSDSIQAGGACLSQFVVKICGKS